MVNPKSCLETVWVDWSDSGGHHNSWTVQQGGLNCPQHFLGTHSIYHMAKDIWAKGLHVLLPTRVSLRHGSAGEVYLVGWINQHLGQGLFCLPLEQQKVCFILYLEKCRRALLENQSLTMGHTLQGKSTPQGLLLANPSQYHLPIFELVPRLPREFALNIPCALHSPAIGRENILHTTWWELWNIFPPNIYFFMGSLSAHQWDKLPRCAGSLKPRVLSPQASHPFVCQHHLALRNRPWKKQWHRFF